MTEIIPFPKSNTERAETVIASVRSFEQLKDAVYELGRFEGSDGYIYTADEVWHIIEGVHVGDVPSDRLTRTHGLRDKVEALLDGVKLPESDIENSLPADLIANADSFEELENILSTKVLSITNEQGHTYEADDLIATIDAVRSQGELLKVVTRSEGLRSKVAELYVQEAIANAMSVADIEVAIINVYLSGASLMGSDGMAYERNDLLAMVKLVSEGRLSPQTLTRKYGLREKVSELQKKSSSK